MIVTYLRFTITALEPFAVAAPEVAVAVDRPVARDPRTGGLHVPVTSLAGSLRSHLRSLGADERLMGSRRPGQTPARSAGDTRRQPSMAESLDPSSLRLLGSHVEAGGGSTAIRRQTAVRRATGSAAPMTLRDRELVAARTQVVLYAAADRRLSEEELEWLAAWAPAIGSGRSTGLGRAELSSLRWGNLDLDDAADLDRYLTLGGPELVDLVVEQHEVPVPEARAETTLLDVALEVVDGLLASGDTKGGDLHLQRRGVNGPPVLEGSQLKGLFRSRIEFILGSAGVSVCDSSVEACGSCPACSLFGWREWRGALEFHPCVVQEPTIEWRDHVGIDRISGGARDHLLFREETVTSGWLRLRVSIRAGADVADWVEPLLLWVVRDLHDGLVGLGGRTGRGLGTVRVADHELQQRLTQLPRVTELLSSTGASSTGSAPEVEVSS